MDAGMLEKRLFEKRTQYLIAKEIEGAIVESGQEPDALLEASFYITLEKDECEMKSYVMVRIVDFEKKRKGKC